MTVKPKIIVERGIFLILCAALSTIGLPDIAQAYTFTDAFNPPSSGWSN
jgi:hypothetical protein